MNFRKALFCLAILSAVCTAFSFFAQYKMGMNPCVLCISQRVLIIVIGLVALISALCPNRSLVERSIYSVIGILIALGGLCIAFYQIYIQYLPEWKQPTCGAPWSFRLRNAPLFDWFEPLIRGTGNCGEVQRLMGIPLPVWGALFFSITIIWISFWWWRTRSTKGDK